MNLKQTATWIRDVFEINCEEKLPAFRMSILLAIKYLYILLTVLILKDQWYVGRGTYDVHFVFWKEILASAVFVPVSWLVLFRPLENRFISAVMSILHVMYYIPMNSAYALSDESFQFFLLSNGYFAIVAIILRLAVQFYLMMQEKKHRLSKAKKKPLYSDQGLNFCCAAICILFILYKLAYNGLSFSVSMNSTDVYANRAEFQSYLESISGSLFSYAISILRNIVSYASAFYVLANLMQRKWKGVLLGLVCVLSLFSVSAGKSTLLFIAVVVALWAMHELKILKYFDRVLELGVLAVLGICLLEHILLQSDRIFMLIIRRMMYIPAWINAMYVEYFLDNGSVLWTQNVFLLQKFLEPVYDISPLTIINNVYFAGKVPSPNTGLLAEAVMHVGEVGILIYPLLIALVLVVSARTLEPYGLCIQLFAAIRLALQLQNVPMTRTDFVLSYFLFIAMLWIVPKLNLPQMYDFIRVRFVALQQKRK